MENILRVLKVVKTADKYTQDEHANNLLLGKAYKLGLSKEQGAKMTNEQVSEYIAKHSIQQGKEKQGSEEGKSEETSKEDTNQYRTPEDMVEGELKKLGKTDEDIKKLTRADYDYYAQVFSKMLGISFENNDDFHNTKYMNRHEYDSINDALTDEEIDQLIKEEEDAIASYEAALKVAVSPVAKDRLQHILEEEQEHVQELRALKAQPTHDSEKDVYEVKNEMGHYVVYKNNIRFASCDSFSEAVKEIKNDGGNV